MSKEKFSLSSFISQVAIGSGLAGSDLRRVSLKVQSSERYLTARCGDVLANGLEVVAGLVERNALLDGRR